MKRISAYKYMLLASLLASRADSPSLSLTDTKSRGHGQSGPRYVRPIVFQGGEPSATAKKIVAFAQQNKGKRIGDGECWGLVNSAYCAAGIRHRGGRVWGRRVHWQKEGVRPGDIIEYEYARYPFAYTDANHTSIILKVLNKDSVLVAHQYWNNNKRVTTTRIPLTYLMAGKQTVYRYEP